eukprot:11200680-Lingulodinium_polyedra.AAC.1
MALQLGQMLRGLSNRPCSAGSPSWGTTPTLGGAALPAPACLWTACLPTFAKHSPWTPCQGGVG